MTKYSSAVTVGTKGFHQKVQMDLKREKGKTEELPRKKGASRLLHGYTTVLYMYVRHYFLPPWVGLRWPHLAMGRKKRGRDCTVYY